MSESAQLITFSCHLPPGDLCTLTAAIKSLHDKFPGEFVTDIRCAHPAIFKHNKHISKLSLRDSKIIRPTYLDLINASNHVPAPFLLGFAQNLGRQLGIRLTLTTNKPDLYLSEEEEEWEPPIPQPFCIICAGTKRDFTTKQWSGYQQIVEHFKGQMTFVQVGRAEDQHFKLSNAVDMIGKTTLRELMVWLSKAEAGIGTISLLQHLCAGFDKPYFCIAGGRENSTWIQYPKQQTFHTIGQLDCCAKGGCWKTRTVALGDDAKGADGKKLDESLCKYPVHKPTVPIPRCMEMIRPLEIILSIERLLAASSRKTLT